MTTVALAGFYVTLGFILVQAILVGIYVRYLKRSNREASDFHPSVAILLCIRGKDPSLDGCMKALVSQDYPDYQLIVVGDHEDDPGVEFCRKVAAGHPDRVIVSVNSEILDTCSVKCSNLIHAMTTYESKFDFFVLVDADTVPEKSWLKGMVQPFQQEDVFVTTGIRWFDVAGSQLGTWIRYIWNTAAIVQMVCYKIPWGGSLGIRTSFVRDADVLDEWSRGFCEDTMLQKLAGRAGGKVEVVPDAIIASSEQTTTSNCIPWISRQLLTARLHHPKWPLVLSHGLFTTVLTFGTLVMALVAYFTLHFTAALWFALSYGVLQMGNFGLLNWIESPVKSIKGYSSTFLRNPFVFLVSILGTQVCYVVAVFKTVLARIVDWRQIRYRIKRRRIEMTGFMPYQQTDQDKSL